MKDDEPNVSSNKGRIEIRIYGNEPLDMNHAKMWAEHMAATSVPRCDSDCDCEPSNPVKVLAVACTVGTVILIAVGCITVLKFVWNFFGG